MRVASGVLACLAALAAGAFATPSVAAQSTYHLHGYYKIFKEEATWEHSNDSPWQVVKGEDWIDPQLLHWGYVPVTHDSQRLYCLIDDKPRTGSNLQEKTFFCGDPAEIETAYADKWKPNLRLYGGGH